ncbi:MAG: protease complex subunit PrcB family protein [Richelia sp. RM2_1_2]|nr:protease complex subunit PrcB family protein [Richelia sp. SM2_1_7]NJM23881.1 protease complex subunit PrcB family protein [Richelia sp. SM1_7_0]NJN10768.1 protease complex subunit PrcB family protein [Richelia sp. RM1_1_1]NJO26114.1 protease complex subunit PrcB family protein [Richelia sp. SL_2_1]NJO58826.1 protease complex subunit PrcB family protein [Richelia sp. RM2_1_2]
MKLDFTTIEKGTNCGYEIAERRLIDSPEEWSEVWQQFTSDTIPAPSVPEIDFLSNQVIAVFAGNKPTGGYSVEILAVENTSSTSLDESSLELTVEFREPQPGEIVTEEITQPYHIIKVPQINARKVVLK